MYGNVGKRIKGLVKTIVILSMAVIILFAIVCLAVLDIEYFWQVLIILLGAGLGCFLAWLSGMTLYAYGEIAARLISIDEKLSDYKANETTPQHKASADQVPPASPSFAEKFSDRMQASAASFSEKLYNRTHPGAAPHDQSTAGYSRTSTSSSPAPETPAPTPKPIAERWKCYQCGTSNPMERNYCSECLSSRDWSIRKSNQR